MTYSREYDRRRADDRLEYKRAYIAGWRQRNPDYQRTRYQTNANARIADNLCSSLRAVLARLARRQQQTWHSNSTIGRLIGCDPPQFRAHIEALFQPGMSWANRGHVWQIDHIKPVASFDLTDPDQRAACFHRSNLRPLFVTDNQRRNRKN